MFLMIGDPSFHQSINPITLFWRSWDAKCYWLLIIIMMLTCMNDPWCYCNIDTLLRKEKALLLLLSKSLLQGLQEICWQPPFTQDAILVLKSASQLISPLFYNAITLRWFSLLLIYLLPTRQSWVFFHVACHLQWQKRNNLR